MITGTRRRSKAGSHLARGAWIEMITGTRRRSKAGSHLARGAWIEIVLSGHERMGYRSHLARGAWIEIVLQSAFNFTAFCRTSQEVRGLKYYHTERSGC